jgi:hypothetical protein
MKVRAIRHNLNVQLVKPKRTFEFELTKAKTVNFFPK